MYSAYSAVITFISKYTKNGEHCWSSSFFEVVAFFSGVLLWEWFCECNNILDSIAIIWDVPEGKKKKG